MIVMYLFFGWILKFFDERYPDRISLARVYYFWYPGWFLFKILSLSSLRIRLPILGKKMLLKTSLGKKGYLYFGNWIRECVRINKISSFPFKMIERYLIDEWYYFLIERYLRNEMDPCNYLNGIQLIMRKGNY